MESYIVRIYRRDPEDPQKLAGLVEIVEREEQRTFKDFEDLRSILICEGDARDGKTRSQKTRRT